MDKNFVGAPKSMKSTKIRILDFMVAIIAFS